MSRRRKTHLLTVALSAGLLVPSAVSAQGIEPRAPSSSPPPSAAAAQGGGGETRGGGAEGGDATPEAPRPSERIAGVSGLGRRTPRTHNVRSGDTLWDITNRYYRSPYRWPEVWSYNPHITNPHWIFPGDVVYLNDPTGAGNKGMYGGLLSEPGIIVLAAGFYTDEDLSRAGRVLFSPEEKRLLTLTDEVYVTWGSDRQRRAAEPGQRFAVMRADTPAEAADLDGAVAHKLRLVGTIDIIYNDGETLPTGVISNAYLEIERGDILMPAEQQLIRLVPKPSDRRIEGRIMDSFEVLTQLGEQHYVMIDRGREDGVEVGHRFLAFEQREGFYHLHPREDEDEDEDEQSDEERREQREWEPHEHRSWPLGSPPEATIFPDPTDDRVTLVDEDGEEIEEDEEDEDDDPFNPNNYSTDDLPRRLIGEIIILQTRGRFSTGLITHSSREININHRVSSD